MNYAVFLTQLQAQLAASAIWQQMQPLCDKVAATDQDVSTPITTAWDVPWQRATDGQWVIAVNPNVTVTGQNLWDIEPYDPSWRPATS